MATNVPQITFSSTGITVPTEAEILAGVQADFNAAFGGNLNPSLETPQGQLASSLAAIIAAKDAEIANLVNQFDPDNATGRFQDAIGKIYFLTRIPSSGTVVAATCSGLNGTNIPLGAQAVNSSTGDRYVCTTPVTLSGGTGVAYFTCSTPGPIACPPAALDTIFQAIPGWDSITNASAGVIGRNEETRAEFEQRRRNSVAIYANGYVGAIRARVLAVSGVLSCYVRDNPTSSSVTYGGVTIAANSVYIAVVGGSSTDIGYAIWRVKPVGTPYAAGNTTVTVYDTSYQTPYPSYDVTYTVPTNVPIYFAVQIRASTALPYNINTLIKNAIIAAFTGADGSDPVQIGFAVYAADYYSTVNSVDASCHVLAITIGTAPSPAAASVNMNINQYPTISDLNITVTQV